jgi:predicted nucleotidyltransferase
MRISRTDKVAGQPIKRVRHFLRCLREEAWSRVAIAEFFGVSPKNADAIIKVMLTSKIIERSPPEKGDRGTAFYTCGEHGRRLRNALLLKPLTRAKAETLVQEFLRRLAEVNADQDLLYVVTQVRIFGSYIESRDDLGDIDLAIEIRPKLREGVDWIDQLLARASKSNKRFRSYLDRLTYAYREVLQALKAKCPYLTFHPMDDLQQIGAPSQVLFKEDTH